MKKVNLFLILGLSLVMTSLKQKGNMVSEPIAVVELFTSQGCSSCPAADKLLSEMVDSEDKSQVFGLSFHVSYWNRLGWKDPYSSEAFTNRQRKYAAVMNLQTIYTPQMIVNGKHEFVGSSKSKADYFVKSVLNETPEGRILVGDISISDGTIVANYVTESVQEGDFVNFAVVQKEVQNYVPRGENHGLTLKHENVVRSFKTVYAKESDQIELGVDSSIELSECLLIAYVQDRRNLRVYAAQKFNLQNIN